MLSILELLDIQSKHPPVGNCKKKEEIVSKIPDQSLNVVVTKESKGRGKKRASVTALEVSNIIPPEKVPVKKVEVVDNGLDFSSIFGNIEKKLEEPDQVWWQKHMPTTLEELSPTVRPIAKNVIEWLKKLYDREPCIQKGLLLCGRTGVGKSSLINVVLRTVERDLNIKIQLEEINNIHFEPKVVKEATEKLNRKKAKKKRQEAYEKGTETLLEGKDDHGNYLSYGRKVMDLTIRKMVTIPNYEFQKKLVVLEGIDYPSHVNAEQLKRLYVENPKDKNYTNLLKIDKQYQRNSNVKVVDTMIWPLILSCENEYAPNVKNVRNAKYTLGNNSENVFEIVKLPNPSISDMLFILNSICRKEKITFHSEESLKNLAKKSICDARKCINVLQFVKETNTEKSNGRDLLYIENSKLDQVIGIFFGGESIVERDLDGSEKKLVVNDVEITSAVRYDSKTELQFLLNRPLPQKSFQEWKRTEQKLEMLDNPFCRSQIKCMIHLNHTDDMIRDGGTNMLDTITKNCDDYSLGDVIQNDFKRLSCYDDTWSDLYQRTIPFHRTWIDFRKRNIRALEPSFQTTFTIMKEDLVSSSQMSTMAMFNTLKTVDLFQPHVIFHYVTNMWYFIRACFTQKDETVANILQIKLLENMEWMMTDEKMLNVLDEDEDVNQLIDSFFMRRVKSSKEWMKQLSITKEQMDDQPLQIHWMKVDLFLWKKHFQKHEISDNTPARKIVVKENSIFRRDDMKKIQSFYAYSLVLMGVTPDLWDEYRRKYLYFGKNFRVEKGMLMIGEKLNDLPTTTELRVLLETHHDRIKRSKVSFKRIYEDDKTIKISDFQHVEPPKKRSRTTKTKIKNEITQKSVPIKVSIPEKKEGTKSIKKHTIQKNSLDRYLVKKD